MSENKTWQKEGEELSESMDAVVNGAISSGDYSSLNSDIAKVLSKAADVMHDSLAEAIRAGQTTYRAGEAGKGGYQSAQSKVRHTAEYEELKESVTGTKDVVSIVPSVFLAWLLGFGAAFLGITFLGGLLSAATFGGEMLAVIFIGALLAADIFALRGTIKKIKRCKQARKILKLMGGKDTMTLEEIADAFGKEKDWAADEVQGMIRSGVFKCPAYIDKEKTTFMTSKEAYRQYQETMKAYREKQKSAFDQSKLKEYNKLKEGIAAREQYEARKKAELSEETQKVLEEGGKFISHIHQKNDEIPGEEISAKIDRLETTVTHIFRRVEADPESAPDLRRLMNYYLPTTKKLIDTYATLDAQQVKGENIETAKRQIEASLDTINDAFEKFLDQFFQDTAWDVSSDISVMDTMMKQDGLVGGRDFKNSQKTVGAAQTAGAAQAQAAQAVQTGGAAQAQAAQAVQTAGAAQAQTAQAVQEEEQG